MEPKLRAAALFLPETGARLAALRWPRQASALSELRPGAECPCGHCVAAHHRAGRLVYKYAPSQPLTFPLGPGISVAMGQEPIWLNAAIDGGQNCLHTGGGDGRAGYGLCAHMLGAPLGTAALYGPKG